MSEINLDELARQARNDYNREWRAKNKDRVRAINARYWAKRAAKIAAEQQIDESQTAPIPRNNQ